MILESLKREDTQVGAWLNVVGYVEEVLNEEKMRQGQAQRQVGFAKRDGDRVRDGPRAVRVRVQAVMLWNAGGVKIGEYERTLGERLESEKEVQKGVA